MSRLRRVAVAASIRRSPRLSPRGLPRPDPYIPYFGKNQIRYDKFNWYTLPTDHFIMYYYPEIEPHLERMAGYAESAYQHVSSELKYDLAHKVPLILFQTSSEFQQQNVVPGAAQEGVGAFAEPIRQRIVMPMDEPPDLLYRLIVHELTHQFDYDIIPASLVRRGSPLWIHEGLADYMTGEWRPTRPHGRSRRRRGRHHPEDEQARRLQRCRRRAHDLQPRPRHLRVHRIEVGQGRPSPLSLLAAQVGHRRRRGRYEEAFKITADEFDQQFDKYLKERFKPFRDKERPADYGRNLGPTLRRHPIGRSTPSSPRRRATCSRSSPATPATAKATSSSSRGRTARSFEASHRLRQGQGVRVHRHARRPLGDRAVADVVSDRRSARLLRAHGEVADVDSPERPDAGRRGPHRDANPRRARVAGLLA